MLLAVVGKTSFHFLKVGENKTTQTQKESKQPKKKENEREREHTTTKHKSGQQKSEKQKKRRKNKNDGGLTEEEAHPQLSCRIMVESWCHPGP